MVVNGGKVFELCLSSVPTGQPRSTMKITILSTLKTGTDRFGVDRYNQKSS
jgi:hypothetical protein